MTTPASLYDVWRWDFGRRVEDGPLWRHYLAGRDVCSVGCGDGRVMRLVCGGFHPAERLTMPRWTGIDIDPRFGTDFLRAAEECHVSAQFTCGDIAEPKSWEGMGHVDVAACAYSTLYLVPHQQQIEVLRNAASVVRRGGRLVFEVFVPTLLETGSRLQVNRIGAPTGERHAWFRRTIYLVDQETQTTQAKRYYGAVDDTEERLVVQETIYWRQPAELLDLARGIGAARLETADAAPGFVALVVDL